MSPVLSDANLSNSKTSQGKEEQKIYVPSGNISTEDFKTPTNVHFFPETYDQTMIGFTNKAGAEKVVDETVPGVSIQKKNRITMNITAGEKRTAIINLKNLMRSKLVQNQNTIEKIELVQDFAHKQRKEFNAWVKGHLIEPKEELITNRLETYSPSDTSEK